jgi:hypothetical protein
MGGDSYSKNCKIISLKRIKNLISASFLALFLLLVFCCSFNAYFPYLQIQNSSAQLATMPVLDCSDPVILPANRKAGSNCIMRSCLALPADIKADFDGLYPNCVIHDCSDPLIGNIHPGVNCFMKSCSQLAPEIANPNVNCVLPNCKDITTEPLLAGSSANCSYLGLPLCKRLDASARHPRINCADLIDLPLASDIKASIGHNIDLRKNAVIECRKITNPNPSAIPTLMAGKDYAIHNKDCIRFCDNVEEGLKAENGVNCVARKCNQLPLDVVPLANKKNPNCLMQSCSLLTDDELNDVKFNISNRKYCESSNVKCYQFSQAQLPFIRQTRNEAAKISGMCTLHNCPLEELQKNCGINETFHITKREGKNSDSYSSDYKKYITGNLPIDQICTPLICKPVLKRAYRCLPFEEENPTIPDPNSQCDKEGENSKCDAQGFCYKKIDCNLTANSSLQECMVASDDFKDISKIEDENSVDAWFYRPVPLHSKGKGVNENGFVVKHIQSNNASANYKQRLCYKIEDLKNNGWGSDTWLGYFHNAVWLPGFADTNASRSPGLCQDQFVGLLTNIGTRGIDYLSLCGTQSLLYHAPDPMKTAYIQSYVHANYEKQIPEYKITVCTRFKNIFAIDEWHGFQACGKRECTIACLSGNCTSQACGSDICRELVIKDNKPDECKMDSDMFTNSLRKSCLGVIDEYSAYSGIRVRAVKYNNRICAFMDVRGHLAYNPLAYPNNESKLIHRAHFFNGQEKFDDGTCVSGQKDQKGNCKNGFDTNQNRGLTSNYRTIFSVPYIGNVLPKNSAVRGYYDQLGRLFEEQECANIPLKVGPPKMYNLATKNNSITLFHPPLYIVNANIIRGGNIAQPKKGELFGTTDFFYPEIEVGFGSTRKLMSLGAGYTGYETTDKIENDCNNATCSSPAITTISTLANNSNYSADILVRKEFDPYNLSPLFCVYEKVIDSQGFLLEPLRIGCVNRNYPEINNYKQRLSNPDLPVSKLVIELDPMSSYNNSKVWLRYLINSNPNKIDNNCRGDDNCSPAVNLLPIKFEKISADTPVCNYGTGLYPAEQYPLCVKRDVCSKLTIECVDNEIAFENAKNALDSQNTDFSNYLAVRKNCNEDLLQSCNFKKGIASTFDQFDNKAYGWFNEVCVTSGFKTKLKKVIAYKLSNNITSKCLISEISPYLNDKNPATNCNQGGKAPGCICKEYIDDEHTPLNSEQIIREETLHEAGLCVDLPTLATCPAINHILVPNNDRSDFDYSYQSLNKNSYNPANIHSDKGVDISHKYRSQGSNDPFILLAGHADFPEAFARMTNIVGKCNGYWRRAVINNIKVSPTLSCISSNKKAVWEEYVANPCVRYACEPITTLSPDENGNYRTNYSTAENNEDKGLKNGFANWPLYLKTNDFLEDVSATSCIYGFKPVNSVAINKDNKPTAYIFHTTLTTNGLIAGYTNGVLPTRQCNQLGSYLPINANHCKRITCLPINPPTPQDVNDFTKWKLWFDSRGATFGEVKASRSNVRIQSESFAIGTCNESLGFFKSGTAPIRGCDYLGNWQEVQNPCTTKCNQVEDIEANSANAGFAKWEKTEVTSPNSSTEGKFLSCIPGYVINPYTNGAPTRKCILKEVAGNIKVSLWQEAKNGCVNQCPGADLNPVVGITSHNIKNAKMEIRWSNTALSTSTLDSYAYASSQDNLNASHFQPDRTDGHYLLRRKCNSDGTWKEPEVMCAINNAVIGNASYNILNQPTPSKNNAITIGQTISANSCVDTTNPNNGQLPIRQCQYANRDNNIDEIYLALINKDCKKAQCKINDGEIFGNSIYHNKSRRADNFDAGQSVSLNCKEGYGHKEGGFRKILTPEADICQSSSRNWFDDTDRIKSSPTITCGKDGKWQEVENDCTLCKSCTNNSPIKGQTSVHLTNSCVNEEFCLYNATTAIYYNSGKDYGDKNGGRKCQKGGGQPLVIDSFIIPHLGTKATSNYYSNNCSAGIWPWNWDKAGYSSAAVKLICYDGRIYSRMLWQEGKKFTCDSKEINFDKSTTTSCQLDVNKQD